MCPANRNIVAASDAGRGIVKVAEQGIAGRRYLITGVNSDMEQLTTLIARLSGQPAPQPISLTIAETVATIQEMALPVPERRRAPRSANRRLR